MQIICININLAAKPTETVKTGHFPKSISLHRGCYPLSSFLSAQAVP